MRRSRLWIAAALLAAAAAAPAHAQEVRCDAAREGLMADLGFDTPRRSTRPVQGEARFGFARAGAPGEATIPARTGG